MIAMYSSGASKDRKLLAEAQQMLSDSKAKIEYIKMRINKAKQNQSFADGDSSKYKGVLVVSVSSFAFYRRFPFVWSYFFAGAAFD